MSIVNNKKYLALAVVTIAVVFEIFHYFLHEKMENMLEHEASNTATILQTKTTFLIDAKKEAMLSLAVGISQNDDIKDALLANDPSKLQLAQLSQKFKEVTNYKNVWFQVIDNKGVSFYRSWIDKRGDDLSLVRPDVKKMLIDKKVSVNISTGRFDMTFKAMVPVFDNDQFLGALEIITHFNSIAQVLQKENIHVAFVVDKSYKKQLTKSVTNLFINDYYIANYNVDKNLLGYLQKGNNLENLINLKNTYYIDHEKNRFFTLLHIPDITGKKMGYAIISADGNMINRLAIEEFHKDSITYFISIVVFGFLWIFFLSSKRTSEVLAKSLDQVQTILDTQPTIIIITDGKKINEANNRFLKFFSEYKTLKDFKKEHNCICDFFVSEITTEEYITYQDGWLDTVLNNPTKEFKVAIDRPDKRHHFIVKGRSTTSNKEKNPITVVTFIEITEQMDKDRMLLEQTKMASLGEMIGNIAHQWRQPLSVISSSATGLMLKNELDLLEKGEVNKFLDAININAQYLSKTIEDFRNFIKGESQKEEFVLKESIDSFVSLVETSMKKYNIKVDINIDPDIKIVALRNELNQCLLNFFNNAKDAMVEHNIEHRYIKIDGFVKEGSLYLIFHDNGGGIPKEFIHKIFEPYFTTKHKSIGTGLGLNMVYRLITEGMKGDITIVNEKITFLDQEYMGAKFTISFPL